MELTEEMKEYLEQISMYETIPNTGVIQTIPENMDLSIDNFHFNFSMAGARLFIYGNSDISYDIYFVDNDTNTIKSFFKIKPNNWVASYEEYYVNWRIDVKLEGADISETKSFIQDLYDKHILVKINTSALGDNIAYIPVIEEFRKKHKCKVSVMTLYPDYMNLFKPYKNINFVAPNAALQNIEYKYSIGWYGEGKVGKMNKRDCHDISLQQIAGDALGIELNNIDVPFIKVNTTMPVIKGDYVVISPFSTAQMKLWNNDRWQDIVNYLYTKNISTVVIGKGDNYLENVIDYTGTQSLSMLRNIIHHSKFGIYLPSGLSWLNWSMDKDTIMITGISESYCEFKNKIHRIEPVDSSCKGCFNNKSIIFDRFDWNHCVNLTEKFECTEKISLDQVIEKIDMLI